jgi:DNA polymerase
MSERSGDPRSRLRWWLRSERAFGLSFVPAASAAAAPEPPLAEALADQPAAALETPADEPPRPPPATPRPATAAVALFAETLGADAGLLPPAADAAPFDAPPLGTEEKRQRLAAMDNNEVRGCTKCPLCHTRDKTVFGEGNPDAPVFFIGEGPGATEDARGRPFVGRAGELLNKMIAGMGLKREDVYIGNVVKCRAFITEPYPKDRAPAPEEVAACTPYLQRQLEIVRPRVIVTLGLPASRHMLQSSESMGRMRGKWHTWRGIKLMPTYHPAFVLRNYTDDTRRAVWSDLKQVMTELNLPEPKRGKS